MAGTTLKKRTRDDTPKVKPPRPTKKQRKQALDAYHSDSDADANADEFPAVNLLDSDSDDIHNARADTAGASDDNDDDHESDASSISSNTRPNPRKRYPPSIARNAPPSKLAHDAPRSSSVSEDGGDNDDDDDNDDEYSDLSASGDEHGLTGANAQRVRGSRAKRSDPSAFATSLSKILSTKLSTSRRADPVLARSAAAHEAGRQAVDRALESKARKQLRTAKRAAMEKGRVRDVLVATNGVFGANVHPVTGEVLEDPGQGQQQSVGAVVETERRLRKVAQRGVVQLFNAFRVAQVKAAEAEKGVRKEGVIGVDRKKEKVTEMSKKGFLDLIASGGGGLKKGPMEEA